MRNKLLFTGLIVLTGLLILSFFTNGISPDKVADRHAGAGSGIEFLKEENWNLALKKAGAEGKLIFLDAYASWCGPCKLLKRKTFPDHAAGAFFNKNFVNIAIDMEKGDGPMLAEKYNVNGYPTLIVTDATGKPIAYTQGYMRPEELIRFGEYALTLSGK